MQKTQNSNAIREYADPNCVLSFYLLAICIKKSTDRMLKHFRSIGLVRYSSKPAALALSMSLGNADTNYRLLASKTECCGGGSDSNTNLQLDNMILD